jgi:hypothetical protein
MPAWAEWAVGAITVIGFVVTIWQLTRNRNAIEKARMLFQSKMLISESSQLNQVVSNIIKDLVDKKFDLASLECAFLRDGLMRLRNLNDALEFAKPSVFTGHMSNLGKLQDNLFEVQINRSIEINVKPHIKALLKISDFVANVKQGEALAVPEE